VNLAYNFVEGGVLMKRVLLVAVLVFAVVMLFAQAPKRGGTLYDYFTTDRMAFDAQEDTTLQTYALERLLFSTLVRYKGETLELEPELLAKMPEISED
jgi:ABC-type oligopeptide transport system substrate-binding subunit